MFVLQVRMRCWINWRRRWTPEWTQLDTEDYLYVAAPPFIVDGVSLKLLLFWYRFHRRAGGRESKTPAGAEIFVRYRVFGGSFLHSSPLFFGLGIRGLSPRFPVSGSCYYASAGHFHLVHGQRPVQSLYALRVRTEYCVVVLSTNYYVQYR